MTSELTLLLLLSLIGSFSIAAGIIWWFLSPLRTDVLSTLLPRCWLPPGTRKSFRRETSAEFRNMLTLSSDLPSFFLSLFWCHYCMTAHFSLWVLALSYPLWSEVPHPVYFGISLWLAQSSGALAIYNRLILKR